MNSDALQPISALSGTVIKRWSGVEMALGGGNEVLDEFSDQDGAHRTTAMVWEHPSIPFVQFIHLDLALSDGRVVRIISEVEGNSHIYGLHFIESEALAPETAAPKDSIYRRRELPELPTGAVRVEVAREKASSTAIDVYFHVNGAVVRLLAGEVYERDERFEIVEADESILIQLNGQRPNWSLHSDAHAPHGRR